jgi:putative ATP-dependent endonuclease of the OLD family
MAPDDSGAPSMADAKAQDSQGDGIFLKSLSISGFRRFTQAEVSVAPRLSVIVGENNSGKTAIVDAIRALSSD